MQFFHPNPQMTGNNVIKDRFVIPWEVVLMHMNPLGVQSRCLNSIALAKPAWIRQRPVSRSKEICSPGHQDLGRSRTRDRQEGFASWLGSPLASPLPPTMTLLQPRGGWGIFGVREGVDFTNPRVIARKSLASVLTVLR